MKVAYVSRDLMDRSRIDAVVRAKGFELVALEDADLILADLRQVGVDDVRAWSNRATVIVFGPHVQRDELAAVSRAGALALSRSIFFQTLPEILDQAD